MNFVDWTC
jgi:ATPase family AAA domain-containing protein 3A/B